MAVNMFLNEHQPPGHKMVLVVLFSIYALCHIQNVFAQDSVFDKELDTVPHRTSDDKYMNPCKAKMFLGDIALADDEIAYSHTPTRSRRDTLHTGRSSYQATLSQKKHFLDGLAMARTQWYHNECLNNNTEATPECEWTNTDVEDITNRLDKLRTELQALKQQPPRRRYRRAATADRGDLWKHGVIPYIIGANFTGREKALFQLAMRHWENHTCIIFREREPSDRNYIMFGVQSCGCCSFVGMKGIGGQTVSLGKDCDKHGVVVHELGHAIGFWHEHTRPDRDNHVQIITSNIEPGQNYNFDKMSTHEIDSLGETYDYGSIMHYSRNTFAKENFLDTILPRRRPGQLVLPEIGQRLKLSPGDIRQANKLYRCSACGRTLQDSTGTFHHFPTRGKPEVCQWRISATHGEKIIMNVTSLNIPKSYDCKTDYLEVRDGYYFKSPLIGRYCGSTLPKSLESTGTRMWIQMKSRIGQGRGFRASYEARCGGEIKKDEGFLSSPNYPEQYGANKNCSWTISVPRGYTVALQFQSFEVERYDKCRYDHVEIRDGPNATSPVIGRYCGFKTPDDVTTTGNEMFIRFYSDGNVQKMGFYALFTKEMDECKRQDHGCAQICENTLGGYKCSCRVGYELHSDGKTCQEACGGSFKEENGTITSPSYPELYPPDKKCIWQLEAPKGHKIHLDFTHFDMEGSNQDCEYDSLRVSSGHGNKTKLHDVFCGEARPPPVTSMDNKMQVEFNSDSNVQKTGFRATYQIDKDECAVNNGGCHHVCKNTLGSYHCECNSGYFLHTDSHGCKEGGCNHNITTTKGSIQSPEFPEDYPSRTDCVWRFHTSPGHHIRLTFRTFELEPHGECTYDHVSIHDGTDKANKTLGRYCGARLPKPVVSSSNDLLMVFFSDVSVERKGFDIVHDTVCGGDLQADDRTRYLVSHPQYGDNNYTNGAECLWTIKAKRGDIIRMEFRQFHVEYEDDCRYDSLQIYDGKKATDRLVGIYCGARSPSLIMSQSNTLLVHFQSDDTIVEKGFKLQYSVYSPLATPRPTYSRRSRRRRRNRRT